MRERAVISHPSFGVLKISRQQGGGKRGFFGADYPAENCISLSISHANLERSLGRNWISQDARLPIIEIHLTEVQFAQAITSLNIGSGTPCTLQYNRSGDLQKIDPPPEHMTDIEGLKAEVVKAQIKTQDGVKALGDKLEELMKPGRNPKKGDIQNLMGLFRASQQGMNDSINFYAKSGVESIQKAAERGKMEVSAYAQLVMQQVGLKTLQDGVDAKALHDGRGPG